MLTDATERRSHWQATVSPSITTRHDTMPYGLPKIHKEGAPLRPIVSSNNSVTYKIAKLVASILEPLVGETPHHIHNSIDFVNKVRGLRLEPDETMVSYDVTSLFTCIPTMEAVKTVGQRLLHDNTLHSRTNLNPDQKCQLLDPCLNTTYFQFNNKFYRQKHGCAMGSPVSPIVANLNMEEVEHKALNSFRGTAPSHWFRYVDDTWVKIKTQEVQAFTEHINSVDKNIKFTREDVEDNGLPFLDCDVHIGEDGSLHIGVYRKATHTDQYLFFDSHHPLEHKPGVLRTLQHRSDNLPTSTQAQEKEHKFDTVFFCCVFPLHAAQDTTAVQVNRQIWLQINQPCRLDATQLWMHFLSFSEQWRSEDVTVEKISEILQIMVTLPHFYTQ